MRPVLEKYRVELAPCPLCGKPVRLAPVLEKRTRIVLWGITCSGKCFPQDMYSCQPDNAQAARLVKRWRVEIVPAIDKWKKLSAQSPRCPHCDKPTRLLPVPEKNGTLVMRPVCVQQGCRLPAQWHFSPTKWQPTEMAGQVRRWSRERLQFMLWFSKKLDHSLYKKSGILSCPVCHARGNPVLQRSCDSIGEALWACADCGTPICPAEKAANTQKKQRRTSTKLQVRSLNSPMCAICRRTQGEVEASGSCLEKHHAIPLSAGGDDSKDNLILLCHECHTAWHKAHQKIQGELRARMIVEEPPAKGFWRRLRGFLGF